MTPYTTERVALSALQPWERNYNRHPERQIALLKRSLETFGQFKNIVVYQDRIVAGHGLAQAARELGWTTISAYRLPSDWTPTQVEALLVADNRIAQLSDPDLTLLSEIIHETTAADAELAAAMGYNTDDVAQLLRAMYVPEAPEEFRSYDEDSIETEHVCPRCKFKF